MRCIGNLLITSLLLSCSGRPPRVDRINQGTSASTPSKDTADADDQQESGSQAQKDESPIEFLPFKGSNMRLLSGKAITQQYSRVFKKKSFGWMHCQISRKEFPPEFCQDSIFSPAERKDVGIVEIFMTNGMRADSNMDRAADITLNYFRTLRSGVSLECQDLVKTELDSLKKGQAANNKLIKKENPRKEDLEEFFRMIAGIGDTDIAVSIDADSYVKSFESIVASASDPNAARNDAFVALCISIATDPQLFLF